MTPLGVVNIGVEVVVVRAAAVRGAAAVVRGAVAAALWRCIAVLLRAGSRRAVAAGRVTTGCHGWPRCGAAPPLRTVATMLPRCAGLAVCWLVCCCCVGYCGVPVVPVIGVRRRAHYPKPFFVVAFTFWVCFGRGRGGVSGQVEAGFGAICRTSSVRRAHEPPSSTPNPYQPAYARPEPRASVPQHVSYVHICATTGQRLTRYNAR